MVGKLNLYLKLKPSLSSTPDSSYYKINSNTEIQILIPPNNREPYYFANIYSDENNTMIKNLTEACVNSLLSGTSASVISLGIKGSGKSRTVYGDLTSRGIRNGLCFSIVSKLSEIVRGTAKEINCSITVSFIDWAYLEKQS